MILKKRKKNIWRKKQYTHVGVWEYPNFIQHTVIFSYICNLVDNQHIEKHDHGINTYRWVAYDEISEYNFLPGTKEQIESAIKIRN